jgi:prophage regulatory protein
METLLRLRQVCDLTGLSKTAVYSLIKLGQFPRQLRLTQRRSVCWNSLDIEKWIRSRPVAHPVADPPSSEGTSNDRCSDEG